MAKAIRVRRCFNCGAVLQSSNSKEPGFINKSIVESNKPDAILYCNRCYNKIKEINYSVLDESVDDQIIRILKDANATDALIIWVIDLFAFNGSLNPSICKAIKNLNLIVVGTKRDILGHYAQDNSLEEFLSNSFKEVGLNPIHITLFGHESKLDGAKIIEKINLHRQGHDVYFIGASACGKTSIINQCMKSYSNKSVWNISSEIYPGTKVKVLEIPLSNSSFIYELPGFGNETSILSKLDNENLRYVSAKNGVKMSLRSLSKGEALVIGNVCSLSLLKGKTTKFKVYLGESCEIKKVLDSNITQTFQLTLKKHNIRPTCDNFYTFADYDMFDYEMENDNQVHDIYVSGLGWFSFVGKGQYLRIQFPKGVEVKETLGKIK